MLVAGSHDAATAIAIGLANGIGFAARRSGEVARGLRTLCPPPTQERVGSQGRQRAAQSRAKVADGGLMEPTLHYYYRAFMLST